MAESVRSTQRLKPGEKKCIPRIYKGNLSWHIIISAPTTRAVYAEVPLFVKPVSLGVHGEARAFLLQGSSGFKKHIPGRRGWRGWQQSLKAC